MTPAKPSFHALALFLLCTGLSGGCPPPDPGIPEPDICEQPSAAAIQSLELGGATLDEVFVPWQDGDSVALVFGPQGGAMLPVRLRVRGAEGTCVSQQLTIADATGAILLSLDYPMKLYAQDDGSMVSDTNYAIFDIIPDFDSQVTVSGTVADQTVMYSIRVVW